MARLDGQGRAGQERASICLPRPVVMAKQLETLPLVPTLHEERALPRGVVFANSEQEGSPWGKPVL